MKDSEKPRIPGGGKKKHGDFSTFIKKKKAPSKSHKTGKLIRSKFRDEDAGKDAPSKFKRKPEESEQRPRKKRTTKPSDYVTDGGQIRLNKYIANSGICSRREADNLIQSGVVKVNGIIVNELGSKVNATDKVQIGEQTLRTEKLQYVLLNKPKGFITTMDDPFERNTVIELVKNACKERIYPVGRLDRNTTGLLLFSNDGELTKKLTHPSHKVKKLYHVHLDKALSQNDLKEITAGVELEDGKIKPDNIAYVGEGKSKKEVGVELHSGKNRVVRRIFEKFDYKVVRLDRVTFAGLTKKDLPRGRWRHLTKEEVGFLKML